MRHAIAAVLVALLTACAIPTGNEPDPRTPRHAIEVRGGIPVDLIAVDSAWDRAVACAVERTGRSVTVSPPAVRIQAPTEYGRNGCGKFPLGNGAVYGAAGEREVWVAPDLCALEHEFSHEVEARLGENSPQYETLCEAWRATHQPSPRP